jgi:hypothetical protein
MLRSLFEYMYRRLHVIVPRHKGRGEWRDLPVATCAVLSGLASN